MALRSFACRDEMRGVVEGLIHSSWFPALPGPTRLGVVAAVAQDLTRHRVWGMLSDAEWNRVVQVLQVRSCQVGRWAVCVCVCCVHVWVCAQVLGVYLCVCAHKHMCARAHACTSTLTCVCTRVQASMRVPLSAFLCACLQARPALACTLMSTMGRPSA